MINITCFRETHQVFLQAQKKEVTDALVTLLKFELGYGGQVSSVSETEIVVRTPLPFAGGRCDVVTFSGAPSEMGCLIKAVALWTGVSEAVQTELRDMVVDRLEGQGVGIVTAMAPMLMGDFRMKAVMLAAMYEGCENPKIETDVIQKVRIEDLASAICLADETGWPLHQVMESVL